DHVNGGWSLRVRDDPMFAQSINLLVSRQRAGLRADRSDGGDPPGVQVIVQAELRVPAGGPGKDRAQYVQQPSDILRSDDMQRAPPPPGTDHTALIVERPAHRADIEARPSDAHS